MDAVLRRAPTPAPAHTSVPGSRDAGRRRFPHGLRDGTSRVPDFAHGVARHRGVASVRTEA
ncbi:hypothetical protein [Streptomyces sp. NPDC048584]|uniref:hypothetical protein n=1 Tax=Streptomyces sp. NPDC048584 TaxID=3365573 RepID=UPI003715BCE3